MNEEKKRHVYNRPRLPNLIYVDSFAMLIRLNSVTDILMTKPPRWTLFEYIIQKP